MNSKYEGMIKKSNAGKYATSKGRLPKDKVNGRNNAGSCDDCPQNYNRMYALSQGQGDEGMGNLSPPLDVNCNSFDGQDDSYGFLESASFYGKNEFGDIEQKPLDDESRVFRGLNNNGQSVLVKAESFLEMFWIMKFECIDPQAYEFYYHCRWEAESSTPFLYDSPSITWRKFDVGWDKMPEDVSGWWTQTLYDSDVIAACNRYKTLIDTFVSGTTEMDLDTNKLYNFYKNFMYFSEFLDGQKMSWMNFGDGGTRPWGYNVNYSIDQRGLKSVVEEIMPENDVLLNHTITSIHWGGDKCNPSHPVKVKAQFNDGISTTPKVYCAKRVISTVSLGVLEDESINVRPKIKTRDSPFERRMGNLVKIYFRFPEKFWGDEEYITFLMDEDFRRDTTNKTIKGEYFYNLDHFFLNIGETATNSLFMFMSTPDLDLIGVNDPNVDDAKVSEKIWSILDPLRQKYGNSYVEPNCWYFKDWDDDTLYKGAYGIWKFGATYYDHFNFFQPRENVANEKVLYLSGEASCFNIWGYIEGAYEAGSRDARLIIRDIRNTTEVSAFSACYLQREFQECFEWPCVGN